MRFRELTLRPMTGEPAAGGEARVFRLPDGGAHLAVLRSGTVRGHMTRLVDALNREGFGGLFVGLGPGEEVTLCEVEDGSPVRWQEDGRPSYQDLEKRVKELESQVAMGSGADCAPYTVRP